MPAVKNGAWVRNPIDAFIAAEHEEHGLKPRPEAARAVLLRRVYLDLIGLPPTPEELHAFLADESPDAYEKVVDRLLASPQYGERWGRHWMDVWRYSDWAGWGQQVRDSQPHIWHWRDWIVESLNADKGYDRMVLEMLADDDLTAIAALVAAVAVLAQVRLETALDIALEVGARQVVQQHVELRAEQLARQRRFKNLNSSSLCSTSRSRHRYSVFFSASAKSESNRSAIALASNHWRCSFHSEPGSISR